jgi:CheY-like chemotaxis protein
LRSEPDIAMVILDFELGGGPNGLEIARELDGRLPVIMVSAYSRDQMRNIVSNALSGITLFFDKIEADLMKNLMAAVDVIAHQKSPN